MSLKFALLGYLSTAPASGYEIAHEFSTSLGWFWTASHSQIYPQLHRLEKEGLITGEEQVIGERGRKRIYKPTAKGLAALRRWVTEPIEYPPTRDAERVQLMFLDFGSREELREHLERHVTRYEAEVSHWEDQMRMAETGEHPRLQLRLQGKDEGQRELIVYLVRMALGGMLERSRTELAWARNALRELETVPEAVGQTKSVAAASR